MFLKYLYKPCSRGSNILPRPIWIVPLCVMYYNRNNNNNNNHLLFVQGHTAPRGRGEIKLGKQVSYFFHMPPYHSLSLPLLVWVCVLVPTNLCLPKGWRTDNCFYDSMNSTTPRSVLHIYYNYINFGKRFFKINLFLWTLAKAGIYPGEGIIFIFRK